MRIRTIKPEFFHHEGLFDLERETGLPVRVAFAGLWCAADREGRFKWESRRLGVQILPYDQVDFSRVLDALTTRGFIRKYASGTGVFGVIPTFLEHQVINNREKDSELPEPLEYLNPDACPTRDPRVTHAGKAEGKGREQGREGKDSSSNPVGFDDFWAAYPRKIGKGESIKVWIKVHPPLQQVLATLEWQCASGEWTRDGGRYIPHPATWLNRAGWDDQQTVIHRADAQLAF